MSITETDAAGQPPDGDDSLLPKHRADLEKSGLRPPVLDEHGVYSTVDSDVVAGLLGLEQPDTRLAPALVLPYLNADGSPPDFHRLKPDTPRRGEKNRTVKYEAPRGRGNRAYFTRAGLAAVDSPGAALLFAEGEKKALAAAQAGYPAIGYAGAQSWKEPGSEELIEDLRGIDFAGRTVHLVPDSDYATNRSVTEGTARFGAALKAAGADVRLVALPAGRKGAKQGLDDFLVANGEEAFADLLDAAEPPQPVGAAMRRAAGLVTPEEAADLVVSAHTEDGLALLRYWHGAWYLWDKTRYRQLDGDEVEAVVMKALKPHLEGLTVRRKGDVLMHLRTKTRLGAHVRPGDWLVAPPVDWDPEDLFAADNGILNMVAYAEGRECFIPHTPARFTLASSPVPFEPAAARPDRFLRFINGELFPGRPDEVRLLRQTTGYLLTPDTSHQVIPLLNGAPRGGKGVLLRVFTMLLGEDAVISQDLESLSGPFGLEPLLGKSLMAVGEVQPPNSKAVRAKPVERLLTISGEDSVAVNRKGRTAVNTRLRIKIVLAGNGRPAFPNNSGALAHRLLPIRFLKSFAHKKDPKLDRKLAAELPGILLWAVRGWIDLRNNGGFAETAETKRERGRLALLGNPLRHFLNECCVVKPGAVVPKETLRDRYRDWCQTNSVHALDAVSFSKELLETETEIDTGQNRIKPGDKPTETFRGVCLLSP